MSQPAQGQLLTDGMLSFPRAAGSPGSSIPPAATALPRGVTARVCVHMCVNVCVCCISPLQVANCDSWVHR